MNRIYTKSEQDDIMVAISGVTDSDKPLFKLLSAMEKLEPYMNMIPKMVKRYYETTPLTFEAVDDGCSFLALSSEPVYYSIDEGKSWVRLENGNYTPSIYAGETVMWKGTAIASFGIADYDTKFNVYGRLSSILYEDNFIDNNAINDNAFAQLFRLLPIVSAKNLILFDDTYNNCYEKMFEGCTSLTTAPELNAASLQPSCYKTMFSGCTSLNYIKLLATNISADNALTNWVDGVASEGTFVKDATVTIETGINGIPEGWTVENI